MFTQKVAQKFFGQVWGNSDKNPSHPQKFACSNTYGPEDISRERIAFHSKSLRFY